MEVKVKGIDGAWTVYLIDRRAGAALATGAIRLAEARTRRRALTLAADVLSAATRDVLQELDQAEDPT